MTFYYFLELSVELAFKHLLQLHYQGGEGINNELISYEL